MWHSAFANTRSVLETCCGSLESKLVCDDTTQMMHPPGLETSRNKIMKRQVDETRMNSLATKKTSLWALGHLAWIAQALLGRPNNATRNTFPKKCNSPSPVMNDNGIAAFQYLRDRKKTSQWNSLLEKILINSHEKESFYTFRMLKKGTPRHKWAIQNMMVNGWESSRPTVRRGMTTKS